MEQKYLIDTNVLIDVQMNSMPEAGMKFMAEVIDEEFTVSFITYIEFLGWKDVTQETEDFIKLANVLEIDKEINKWNLFSSIRNYKDESLGLSVTVMLILFKVSTQLVTELFGLCSYWFSFSNNLTNSFLEINSAPRLSR